MTPDELDVYIDELDTRLDRLRALYEQYFLGIEKIEPTVARKDVDRRFWMLRRLQIRNTARRFRLQVLVQRYNTFQQYWARICREIENGTYKRHLIKAEQRFGDTGALTHAARRRLGKRHHEGDEQPTARAESAKQAAEDDLADLLGGNLDLDAELERVVAAAGAPRPAAAPRVGPDSPGAAQEPRAAMAPGGLGDLDLDLDGLDGPPSVPRGALATSGARPAAPGRQPAPPAARAPAPALRPAMPRPAGASPPPVGGASPRLPRPGTIGSGATPRAPGAKPPLPKSASGPGPARVQTPVDRGKPPLPRSAGQSGPVGTAGSAPTGTGRRPPLPGASDARQRPADGAVTDDRVRQLHAELVAAKRKLNQGAQVSVDGLGKTLRATATKLREKHKGQIDFQVVVKDGQAVVRPVVKKPRA